MVDEAQPPSFLCGCCGSTQLGRPFVAIELWSPRFPKPIRMEMRNQSDGKPLAIEGSAGFIEISIRDGNAAELTRLGPGSEIFVHFRT